jgi:hypothetical protein
VADTDVYVDSAALVNAPVSPTLLSQTNPPHPSNDKDSNPNGSPGDEMPCAIRAALRNHVTTMDAVIALEPQTSDEMVAGYFRTMMATLDHRLSGIQRQMATTTADSICNALDQKITPLHENIMTLGNCLDATTAYATTFASTIHHKIADTVTPLHANISTLCNHLNNLDDGNRLNTAIANATTLTSAFCTKMAATVNPLCNNLTAMEACLTKRLDDFGSHMNHITKTVIPDAKDKIYHRVFGTARGQHAHPPDTASPAFVSAPVSTRAPTPVPAKGTPNPAPDGHGTTAPAAAVNMGQQTTQTTDNDGTPPSAAMTPPAIAGSPDFVLPDRHLGSGLSGPTTPFRSEVQGTTNIMLNARLAHKEGHRRRLAMGPPANPYTPPCHPLQVHTATDNDTAHGSQPPSPCLGGPILSPCKNKDWTSEVSHFDMERLAIPHYHGNENGVALLDMSYLVHCGFNMISTDDVITCFNNIISSHCWIRDTWHNPVANTNGPQGDCILLKSFKLFPILESMVTEDIVNFYDWFQELSTSHLPSCCHAI